MRAELSVKSKHLNPKSRIDVTPNALEEQICLERKTHQPALIKA